MPEPAVHRATHQNIATIVAVLAIHARDVERLRARRGVEGETIALRQLHVPRERLGHDDGSALERGPHTLGFATRQRDRGVARGNRTQSVHGHRPTRRVEDNAPALAVICNAGDGKHLRQYVRIEPALGAAESRPGRADVHIRANRANQIRAQTLAETLHHDRHADH